MIGYYIGGYFFMVAIFSGLFSPMLFNFFAAIGAIACALQWIMS